VLENVILDALVDGESEKGKKASVSGVVIVVVDVVDIDDPGPRC